VVVGGVVVVNPFGDVVDPQTGRILAGARPVNVGPLHLGGKGTFANTVNIMSTATGRTILNLASRGNTVIGVVATNARMTKAEATKVAQMAQDGVARTIRPAHTMVDGDTVFTLATGQKRANVSIVGAYAAEVMAAAIIRAVKAARPAAGLPVAEA
jgi:L-aminopeptidase/D-esterase-like protein